MKPKKEIHQRLKSNYETQHFSEETRVALIGIDFPGGHPRSEPNIYIYIYIDLKGFNISCAKCIKLCILLNFRFYLKVFDFIFYVIQYS